MKQFSREEKAWIMYDWANSAFATIMLAAVFPVFFTGIAGGEGTLGSMWWGWGNSISRFILGLSAPVIGALLAYKGYKKRFFIGFMAFGILALLFLSAQSSWQMLLIGYILANMCWAAGNLVYDAYLPDVTTKDRMDKVSTWGFAMGYIGGSTIPFIISIVLILFGSNFGIDMTTAVRISIVLTAIWWGVFSIQFVKDVHHKFPIEKPKQSIGEFLNEVFGRIFATAKKITKNRGLFMFIVAYFFYIDGVGTVIIMATAYGAELGLGDVGLIGALFVTQIVAMPCSILFGKLSEKYNNISIIIVAIVIYIGICLTGFWMGFGLETGIHGYGFATVLFWVLAFLVGTVQGGIQAISRSTFGKLVPAEESGEYFGFYEIFGRFAAILGPFLYATVLSITGRPSFSILSIIFIFAIGLIILLINRKHIHISRS